MTTAAWQDGNNRYLAASLAWLRLRLERLAADRFPPEARRAGFLRRPMRIAPPSPRRIQRELDAAA